VEPSGNVFGCRALETKVGDISALESLFNGSAYKNLAMRTYSNVPACKGCKLEGLCQGVCIGHSEKNFQDIYQPDNKYCDVYRAMFNLVLHENPWSFD
jgi:radical SAM protein with 4Fe4S-binding SPASM domain